LAAVGSLVDVAIGTAAPEKIVHHAGVIGAGGALEVIDAETHQFPLPLELGGDDIAEGVWGLAGTFGGALDVHPVLVRAGGQHGIVALHALEALHHVGDHGGVGVTDVRRGIHVVDGGCEVILHVFCDR
jgi:hypothetical protein